MLSYLRRDAVAYLALLVALSTGSAYAAQELPKKLPKNSVGAKQLKSNAVSSVKIKDGSITSADLASGVVPTIPPAPREVAWVGGGGTGGTPVLAPDVAGAGAFVFTLPTAGTLEATALLPDSFGTCSSDVMRAGLYLDGKPMPHSEQQLTSVPAVQALIGIVPATSGAHTITIGADCATGTATSYTLFHEGYQLVLGQ
jgi:hypothetical protein